MHILMFSYRYRPDIGGIESMSELLAHGFVDLGHEVTVVTATSGDNEDGEVRVLRNPSPVTLARVAGSVDVIFHNNPCLKWAWTSLVRRHRTVVAVRTWVRRNDGRRGLRDQIKVAFIRRATTIANSRAIADDLAGTSLVIPNSYDSEVFFDRGVNRPRGSIIFVGRLVESKGADLLISAIAALGGDTADLTLTVVGEGPERGRLEEQAKALNIRRVEFLGEVRGPSLGELLSSKDVMVVPSRWNEPFGIVALEGIASGCVMVASSGGGLGDAVGQAGLTFENGNVPQLVTALRSALYDDVIRDQVRAASTAHSKSHRAENMITNYLSVLVTVAR